MFGHEAAVKHTLLESENSKYLGTDDGMIDIGLMTKLYHVVAHNLNEARKARDGNKKRKTPKEPEELKVGDNILVRDHTSKAFQPKYKDFCIIGLLGKNQVEIKDNHGHTTKVHHRDVKKIPMTEKVCKLYKEEQVGKTREGRKAVPANKMPNLEWDIAETQLLKKNRENNNTNMTLTLQTVITITIMLATFLEHITAYASKIPTLAEKTPQSVESMITKASCNRLFQNICKTIQAHENSMMSMTVRTSHTHPGLKVTAATSTISCSAVSVNFTQRPNMEMETTEHKTLNNTLVLRNEVLSSTWKLSANHAPYIHKAEIKGSFYFKGSKLENQHTRKTLGTLSWVYKPSDYL